MKGSPRIFLSYVDEDRQAVESLYDQLKQAGFRPWMAAKDIDPGENKESAVSHAIQVSDFFVACLSQNSIIQRGPFQDQIKQGRDISRKYLEDDIYLIPAKLEECPVPDILQGPHPVNLYEEDGCARLVKAIRAGVARRKIPSDIAGNHRLPSILKWIRTHTLSNWTWRLGGISLVLVLMLIAIVIIFASWQKQQRIKITVEIQAQTAIQNFQMKSPDVRITSLAELFQLRGYEEQARSQFFDELTLEEQKALFEQANAEALGDRYIIAVQGIYTYLADNDAGNQLLQAMAQALRTLRRNVAAAKLADEIEQWRRGRSHGRQGDFEGAASAYDAAIDLNGDNIGTHFDRALAYTELGKYDPALADFAAILKTTGRALPEATPTAHLSSPRRFTSKNQIVGMIKKAISDSNHLLRTLSWSESKFPDLYYACDIDSVRWPACIPYFEDFSDIKGEWSILDNEDTYVGHCDGAYCIYNKRGGLQPARGPAYASESYTVQVDAWWGDAEYVGYEYGLMFGKKGDPVPAYRFGVDPTQGTYTFRYQHDDKSGECLLDSGSGDPGSCWVSPELIKSQLINSGTVSNRLKVQCNESTIRLYINGELVWEDDTAPYPCVGGMGLEMQSKENARVYFDNFRITCLELTP